jgi:hypothetical protein
MTTPRPANGYRGGMQRSGMQAKLRAEVADVAGGCNHQARIQSTSPGIPAHQVA